MQKQLIVLTLSDGGSVLVESGEPLRERDVSGRQMEAQLSSILPSITQLGSDLAQSLRKLQPSEFTIEFGLNVVVKSGAVWALIGEAEGTSSVKITVKWQKGDGLKQPQAD